MNERGLANALEGERLGRNVEAREPGRRLRVELDERARTAVHLARAQRARRRREHPQPEAVRRLLALELRERPGRRHGQGWHDACAPAGRRPRIARVGRPVRRKQLVRVIGLCERDGPIVEGGGAESLLAAAVVGLVARRRPVKRPDAAHTNRPEEEVDHGFDHIGHEIPDGEPALRGEKGGGRKRPYKKFTMRSPSSSHWPEKR